MHASVMRFGAEFIQYPAMVEGKRILEIGALNVNGSLREIIEPLGPSEHVGTDVNDGPGVDVVCAGERLTTTFEAESFDAIVCTEVLEHVREWWKIIYAMSVLLQDGGWCIATTRSMGFPYHPYDEDNWRWGIDDFQVVFGSFYEEMSHGRVRLGKDPQVPGVFIGFWLDRACLERRKAVFRDVLRHRRVYNMIVGERVSPLEWCKMHDVEFALTE